MLTSKKLHKSLHEKCYRHRGERNYSYPTFTREHFWINIGFFMEKLENYWFTCYTKFGVRSLTDRLIFLWFIFTPARYCFMCAVGANVDLKIRCLPASLLSHSLCLELRHLNETFRDTEFLLSFRLWVA